MPEISRFFGIIIAMFYNDHPPPHFHVRYGGQRAVIAIEDLRYWKATYRCESSGLSSSGPLCTGANCWTIGDRRAGNCP
jgi:hypothetical protein